MDTDLSDSAQRFWVPDPPLARLSGMTDDGYSAGSRFFARSITLCT
jgi:hypothetical protein